MEFEEYPIVKISKYEMDHICKHPFSKAVKMLRTLSLERGLIYKRHPKWHLINRCFRTWRDAEGNFCQQNYDVVQDTDRSRGLGE